MLSIGGITYVDALEPGARRRTRRSSGSRPPRSQTSSASASRSTTRRTRNPNLAGLQEFIDAYRARASVRRDRQRPGRALDDRPGGRRPLADRAHPQGDRRLAAHRARPVLDYANAMVPARQPSASADAQANWQEHVDGKPQYAPPIPPLAPGEVHRQPLHRRGLQGRGRSATTSPARCRTRREPSCRRVAPKAPGDDAGMLGYMFWAAEKPSARGVSTTPPNTCEGGVGAGAGAYAIPDPDAGAAPAVTTWVVQNARAVRRARHEAT